MLQGQEFGNCENFGNDERRCHTISWCEIFLFYIITLCRDGEKFILRCMEMRTCRFTNVKKQFSKC